VILSTNIDISHMDDIKIRFGRRLRELRLEKGWSQETLANLAEIDRTYIPGIENGKRNVSIMVIEKFALVFEISLSELLNSL
jgi:transcriptional regulator with XRE-family HTH domain